MLPKNLWSFLCQQTGECMELDIYQHGLLYNRYVKMI